MNVELLRKIQAHNTAHPEQLDMDEPLLTRCGTVACIAGHACLLGGASLVRDEDGHLDWEDISTKAQDLLGLNWSQADNLFFDVGWPREILRAASCQVPRTPEYAAIVNARIDHFIATDGAE